MAPVLILRAEKKPGPVSASGRHAELLEEMRVTATTLIKLLELERTGVYDGFNQGFWTGSDSVLDNARQLVAMAEQRVAELRDAAPR